MGATGTGVVVGERELSTGSGRVEMGRHVTRSSAENSLTYPECPFLGKRTLNGPIPCLTCPILQKRTLMQSVQHPGRPILENRTSEL